MQFWVFGLFPPTWFNNLNVWSFVCSVLSSFLTIWFLVVLVIVLFLVIWFLVVLVICVSFFVFFVYVVFWLFVFSKSNIHH